jgi:hypothetical protein
MVHTDCTQLVHVTAAVSNTKSTLGYTRRLELSISILRITQCIDLQATHRQQSTSMLHSQKTLYHLGLLSANLFSLISTPSKPNYWTPQNIVPLRLRPAKRLVPSFDGKYLDNHHSHKHDAAPSVETFQSAKPCNKALQSSLSTRCTPSLQNAEYMCS